MYMVMLILDDPAHLDAVLDAWVKAGITGVTILESTGLHHHRATRRQVAARYALGSLGAAEEFGSYTLLAIVRGEAAAQECQAAAEAVVGDLDGPDNGVLAAWPLAIIKGVPRPGAEEG